MSNSIHQMGHGLITVAVILLAVGLGEVEGSQSIYQLTPAVPPNATPNQYYSVQLRVTGMHHQPTFAIEGLPSTLTHTPRGLIYGTPVEQGTHPLTITYRTHSISRHAHTFITVSNSSKHSSSSPSPIPWLLQTTLHLQFDESLVYRSGQQINIALTASGGTPPYSFAYLRLPQEITGTVQGVVRGVLYPYGYYSFGAVVADATGQRATAFYTFNIQPFFFRIYTYALEHQALSDVPVRDTPSQQEVSMAEKEVSETHALVQSQIQREAYARRLVEQADSIVRHLGWRMQWLKSNYTAMTNVVLAHIKQAQTVTEIVSKAKNYSQKAHNDYKLKMALAEESTELLEIATLTLNQLVALLEEKDQMLQKRQQYYQQQAKKTSKAQWAVKQAELESSKQKVNQELAHQHYKQTKTISEQAIEKQEQANLQVSQTRTKQQVTKSETQKSKSVLQIAQQSASQAMQVLELRSKEVQSLKREVSQAKTSTGEASFKLNQAINRLLVAQARKRQADWSLMLASATLTDDLQPLNKVVTFGGCDSGVYPSMSGSAYVTALTVIGFRLSVGSELVVGSCSDMEECGPGDLVSYQGYLKEGAVHVLWLRKQSK